MQIDLRQKLEQAFSKISVQPAQQWRIPSMAHVLSGFAGKSNIKVPPKFKDVGRTRAQRELNRFTQSIESLIKQLEAMHQPVIDSLADKGILIAELLPVFRRIGATARETQLRRPGGPSYCGRPRKLAADAIAHILAHNYKTLTGKTPTVATNSDTNAAYGEYLGLVEDVFKALGVDANPEGAARNAVRGKRRKSVPKK